MFVTLFGRRNNRGSIRPKSAYYTVPDTSTRMYYRNYIVLFVHPGSSYHTQSKPQKAQHTYYSQDFVQYYTGAWPGTWPVRGGCLGDGLAGAGSFYSSSLYSARSTKKMPTVSNDNRVGYHADRRNSKSLQPESSDKPYVLVSKPRPIVFDSC